MIPVYNRVTYLERALRSVLSQDPGAEEMQIEVVDDASTLDDPEPLVRRLAGGRVSFVRQPRNIGPFANFNSCIERSLGEWGHILHTDDFVLPGFYERLQASLEGLDDVGAAFCRYTFVDDQERPLWDSELERPTSGTLPGFIEKIGLSQRIVFAAIVVRRSVYEKLGGYRTDLPYAGDWEMWTRVAAHYPVWYEPAILATFRVHSDSCTSALVRSARTIVDERRCISAIRPLLPSARADVISRKARELASLRALGAACGAFAKAEFATGFGLLVGGLKCSVSPRVIEALILLPVRIARLGVRRVIRSASERLLPANRV